MNLRFPGLFALLAAVTVVDLVVPDFIPFLDEIVLAILTMIFALWKERRATIVDDGDERAAAAASPAAAPAPAAREPLTCAAGPARAALPHRAERVAGLHVARLEAPSGTTRPAAPTSRG